jgi:hypothetical protein
MSMKSLESAIAAEARRVFENSKLRLKDIMEWSTGPIAAHPGEVVEKMPLNNVWVAIKTECDKRSNATGVGRPASGRTTPPACSGCGCLRCTRERGALAGDVADMGGWY